MNKIHIENRELTFEETEQMNSGFEKLALEEGVEIESTVRFSFVALNGKTFIGCSSGLAYKNGLNYSGWFFLTDLFIEKEFRSQGLGADLLEKLEEQIKTIGVKHIWLWTSGDKAIRFYQRHGYDKFAEMKNWYSDGSSRVGLKKNLYI